jgi:FkbM family methyltransferase
LPIIGFHGKENGLSPLAKFLRLWMRSGIRGRNRVTRDLAIRLKSLQCIPIRIADWPPVYMDLRDWGTHDWLRRSPWPASPREVEEQLVMRRFVREGNCVYDIGANIGLHTALLSTLAGTTGHVYAFEPNPALATCLSATIDGMRNARLFTVALSCEEGEATLFVTEEDHSLSSLADWTSGREQRPARGVQCRIRPLDVVVKENNLLRPDFIKCDVEGAELRVFQGASTILNSVHAPVVLFEANLETAGGFGLPIAAAKEFLASLPLPEYQFFRTGDTGRLAPVLQMDPVHSNILAIPRQRLGNSD